MQWDVGMEKYIKIYQSNHTVRCFGLLEDKILATGTFDNKINLFDC